MKKSTILASLLMLTMSAQALTPWKKGGFETGQYRNLLVEMGYQQADVDAKLKTVFNDVFRLAPLALVECSCFRLCVSFCWVKFNLL